MPRLAALPLGVALAALPLPAASRDAALAVRAPHGWETWWRASEAPARWPAAHPAVAGRVRWRVAAPGLEWGELRLSGAGEAYRTRVVLARLDPARLALRLVKPADGDVFAGRWSVDDAPADAVLAVNAGQFTAGPWGWLVQDGVERQAPGRGPLAPGVIIGDDGRVSLVAPAALDDPRRTERVRDAFQSYPMLLMGDGEVPAALATGTGGLDLAHRDARLALGTLRDGRVLVALTRFDGLGDAGGSLPFGLTTPEMAAVMGALGAQRAVLLDGGISGQLLIRDQGRTRTWAGWRKVALGLVAIPR